MVDLGASMDGDLSNVEEEEESSSEDDKAKGHQDSSSSSSGSSSSSDDDNDGTIEAVSHDHGRDDLDMFKPSDGVVSGDQGSQYPSTQQLFGGDSSGSESNSEGKSGAETPVDPAMSPDINQLPMETSKSPAENGHSRTVEGLFGDTAELSSSEDEHMSTGEHGGADGGLGDGDRLGEVTMNREGTGEEEEEEVPRINVEIPRCVADLGTDLHFVKLPNFLSVETRPFDAELYEDEGDEDEILDEEGRARLKLKVENTIRWRYSQDESGNEVRESNARLVKWTDGTMSLYLGGEIFDIHRQPLQGEFSHLFVRQGTGLQGQAVFRSKLTFRPHSTDSQTHRKMTLSIADRFSKAQKIRVLPAVGKDPESQRLERIKREEENLKAAIRRDHHKRRLRERHLQRGGLSASYLEPDRELESEEDLGAIKSTVRSRLSRRQGQSETSESESDGEGAERLMMAKEEQQEVSKRLPRRSRKLALSDDEDEDNSD